MKIRLLGTDLFHAGGRKDGRTERNTDMKKLMVAIRNFANAPESYGRVKRIDELRRYISALYS